MAAIEQDKDSHRIICGAEVSENYTTPPIAAGNAKRTLDYLLASNARYDKEEDLSTAELEWVRSQIQALRNEETELVAKRQESRSDAQTNHAYRSSNLRKQLNHPASSFSDVYRGVLLASELGGGTLKDKKRFEQAHVIAEGIFKFGAYLEDMDEPQPLVLVRNVYVPDTNEVRTQVDFGFTAPNKNVGIYNSEKEAHIVRGSNNEQHLSQVWLELPVQNLPQPNSAMQSPNNSHYTFADGEVIIIDSDGATKITAATDPAEIPKIGNMRISVPMGNLYPPNPEALPFIMYDNGEEDVEVAMPRSMQTNLETRLCAVGGRAVIAAFNGLVKSVDGKVNSEKVKVLQAMTGQIASDKLGIG